MCFGNIVGSPVSRMEIVVGLKMKRKEKYMKKIVRAVLHGTLPLYWGVILVFVLVAVGLLPLLLKHDQGSRISNISLRPGWQTIISYSGRGSAVITGQHILLPHVYGEGLWCQGGDAVHIAISGATKMVLGIDTCDAARSSVSPQSIALSLQSEKSIQTVTITAAPSTMWRLDFLQEVRAVTVPIGPEWREVINIGGVDTRASAMPSGGTTPAKRWSIVGVCVGDPGAQIDAQVIPPPGKSISLSCDGIPHLAPVRYTSPTTVQEMHVTPAGKHVIFSTTLVTCANEQCEKS